MKLYIAKLNFGGEVAEFFILGESVKEAKYYAEDVLMKQGFHQWPKVYLNLVTKENGGALHVLRAGDLVIGKLPEVAKKVAA